jgi:uncharacterized membrane protein YgcG
MGGMPIPSDDPSQYIKVWLARHKALAVAIAGGLILVIVGEVILGVLIARRVMTTPVQHTVPHQRQLVPRILDFAQVLTDAQRSRVDAMIEELEQMTGKPTMLFVTLTNPIPDKSSEDLASELLHSHESSRPTHNAILVLIIKSDRRQHVFIAVSDDIKAVITEDALNKSSEQMERYVRDEQFDVALLSGVATMRSYLQRAAGH